MSALPLPHWQPSDGATVHLSARNPWQLAAGRYRLRAGRTYWRVEGIATPGFRLFTASELRDGEATAILTPISAAELERERHEVQLRTAAPLRQPRHRPMLRQHDASDLALFRAANEPGLGL